MPGKQLNHSIRRHSSNNSIIICRPDIEEHGTAQSGSDEGRRAYTGLIKASKRAQFSNKARVESSINNNNRFQVFTKELPSRLQSNQDGC